jgi:hypothetical protein
MTVQQFIDHCKVKGVNVKHVTLNKRSIAISYNYDLPHNRVSQTHETNFYHDNLQAVYDDRFSNADKLVRF